MEQQYAQALWQMIEGGMDHKKAVDSLHKKLEAEGRTQMWGRIGKAFERIAQRSLQRSRLTLFVAREKDAHRATSEAKKALETMKYQAKDMNVKVDESLIGGWRLEGAEHLVDASFKKQLLSIYNRSTH